MFWIYQPVRSHKMRSHLLWSYNGSSPHSSNEDLSTTNFAEFSLSFSEGSLKGVYSHVLTN